MKELADKMTKTEKKMALKIGRSYLKVIKIMGIFLILGLIMTTIAAVQAQPGGGVLDLGAGETAYISQFYGEAGDDVQIGFGITKENGQDYQYPEIGDMIELFEFMQTMEWKINMIVEYSPHVDFTTVEVTQDISGEMNFIRFELYKDGFYRVKITNLDSNQLTVSVGKTEVNPIFLSLALVSWILFGMTVGLFTLMVQVGFWLLVIYVIIKAIKVIEEDNNRTHPSIIEPTRGGEPKNN